MPNIYHNFNELQLECYNRNMNCSGCFYSQYNTRYKCRVKKSIIEHILKYGIPENLKTKGVRND
jgi:hypothetical protein